ncbi:uncharacterized protein N7498_003459 [Penicillium cinerascens]|uniref:Uncharacterized protein n=1 Tax=Penicillium cinerascens TaxID=70096 RepID=A0A9W9N266_9EURO|nr:uncharacterized protein N7498_003459 [Penicillium cinerascens]KAJ5211813.1 hypothetical protein N7498_003459 [Penicillium cinerascens]
MKLTSVALTGAALGLAHATPVTKRQAISDADILNYALTLEHLEANFYAEGLKNYTHQDFISAGYMDPFYANLQTIASDEQTHVQFLTSALTAAGANPVAACNYSFTSTDVKSFLALGSVLEGVGVSAYLGAAASIMNGTYLTAAASILTVEARHSAYLRSYLGESPVPQPFDDPLNFDEVYTVASPFIASCPSSNGKLPVKAFPSLTPTSSGSVMSGAKVQLMTGSGFNSSMDMSDIFAAFITVTGPVFTPLMSSGGGMFTVTVPSGVAGQSYVVLTMGNTTVTDDTIVAGPAILEVGAMMGGITGGCSKSKTWSMSGSSSMSMMMPTASPSMSMSMSGSSTMPSGSMSSSSMMPSKSPVFNSASGISPSGAISVLMAAVAAFFM